MNIPVSLLDALDVGKLLANFEMPKHTEEEFYEKLKMKQEKNREYQRKRRLFLTPEQQEKNREYRKKKFLSLTSSQLEKYYIQKRKRDFLRRALATPEQREKMLSVQRECMRKLRQNMTEEEHAKKLAYDKAYRQKKKYERLLYNREYRARKKAERLAQQQREETAVALTSAPLIDNKQAVSTVKATPRAILTHP